MKPSTWTAARWHFAWWELPFVAAASLGLTLLPFLVFGVVIGGGTAAMFVINALKK